MNKYRVDVSDSLTVPCGMNSIRYVGDSFNAALAAFHKTAPGYDKWHTPDTSYGVLLSKWSEREYDYVVMARKLKDEE